MSMNDCICSLLNDAVCNDCMTVNILQDVDSCGL
jgi:hypothetical protein